MTVDQAAIILETIDRSSVASASRRSWLAAAARYAEIRVAWLLADSSERKALDAPRSAAHTAFIDECNILSRSMVAAGDSNAWRAVIGIEREDIGDFACLLHCVLGLRAR